MPRLRRPAPGGLCYHLLNRGNNRQTVFREPADYADFLALLARGQEQEPMRILAFCLMPNHFHLVLWPEADDRLGPWMQRLMTAQVSRHHARSGGSGHLWQGRFKSFPVEEDKHLLTVLRYVERNPSRAGLVAAAEDWGWSSASKAPPEGARPSLEAGPVARPARWRRWINGAEKPAELEALRESLRRERPWGTADWTAATAEALGIAPRLRRPGRPPGRRAEA